MELQQVENVINYVNNHNIANMKLLMSTPSDYVEALKKENITWPVRYEDSITYADGDNDYWSGFYTSRPGAKKQVKDASSLLGAQNKLFAQKVIQEGVKQKEVDEVLEAKNTMVEQISVY